MKVSKIIPVMLIILSVCFTAQGEIADDFLRVGDIYEYELVTSHIVTTIGNKSYDVHGCRTWEHWDEGSIITCEIVNITKVEPLNGDLFVKINITYPDNIKSTVPYFNSLFHLEELPYSMITVLDLAENLVVEWNESTILQGYKLRIGEFRTCLLSPYMGNFSYVYERLQIFPIYWNGISDDVTNKTKIAIFGDHYTFESSWGGILQRTFYDSDYDVTFNDHYKFHVDNKTGMMLGVRKSSWLNGTINEIPIELSFEFLLEEVSFDLSDFELEDFYKTKGLSLSWITIGLYFPIIFLIQNKIRKHRNSYD